MAVVFDSRLRQLDHLSAQLSHMYCMDKDLIIDRKGIHIHTLIIDLIELMISSSDMPYVSTNSPLNV